VNQRLACRSHDFADAGHKVWRTQAGRFGLPDQDHTGAAAGKPRRTDRLKSVKETTTVKIDGVEYERTVRKPDRFARAAHAAP